MSARPLKFDGLDAAIIGVTEAVQGQMLVVYDREKIVRVYISEGMTRKEFKIWEEMINDDYPET